MRRPVTNRHVDDGCNLEACLEAAACCFTSFSRPDIVRFAAEMTAERDLVKVEYGDEIFEFYRRAKPDSE